MIALGLLALGFAFGLISVRLWRAAAQRLNASGGSRQARGSAGREPQTARNQARAADAQSPAQARLLSGVLAALPDAAILVDLRDGAVVHATSPAIGLGLVFRGRLVVPELAEMLAEVRDGNGPQERELQFRRSLAARDKLELLARVAPVSAAQALVMVQNLVGARRVDEVRRDFVANVSHELKTPVGALALLSEAVLVAADDPNSVRYFAVRMQDESSRLTQLVNDLIDLSRIQGTDPFESADIVSVDEVVTEAVDAMRLMSQARRIEIIFGGAQGLVVVGVSKQLITAVRNLLANAIAYSPAATRIAVATQIRAGIVEISVTDQGIGIPESEQERIFERFYRVDQARSRVTGGTGLGLAIVKHVCRNHGGSVEVWSIEGAGSTFTLRIPAAADTADAGAEDELEIEDELEMAVAAERAVANAGRPIADLPVSRSVSRKRETLLKKGRVPLPPGRVR